MKVILPLLINSLVSQNVILPFTSETVNGATTSTSESIQYSLSKSFAYMVHSNACFDHGIGHDDTANNNYYTTQQKGYCSKCYIPAFGEYAKIEFKPSLSSSSSSSSDSMDGYILSIQTETKEDYHWLCTKLLDEMKDFEFISLFPLRQLVANHYNTLPPDPGYDTEETANPDSIKALFAGTLYENDKDDMLWDKLVQDGYVCIDTQIETTPKTAQRLSDLLVTKTGQDRSIRTDSVAFLTRDDAVGCGLMEQYDCLMALASKMNDKVTFETSNYDPISPGTKSRPLTNPREIQAAEYRMNEFYIEHSDNSLDESGIKRQNYRYYTCILYCNDDWDMERDGGALRMYPESQTTKPRDARLRSTGAGGSGAARGNTYVDISPLNGRLVIFDSKLVHSVEKTTTDRKRRLALTLWTLRPEDSGVMGEIYDAGAVTS